jgi:hypothetical protein
MRVSAMPPATPIRTWTGAILVVGLFIGLTVFLTWPQVLHLSNRTADSEDPLLSIWRLRWVAHQLPRAPLALFDGNVFYPERRTLSFSDAVILPAVAAAPLAWLGLNRVLVYNLVLLSGFVLSGCTMFLLVKRLTGNAVAGVFAGVVFAFAPYRFDHFEHLELQHAWAMPLALWACHRTLDSGRLSDGMLTGLALALQSLCSLYYGIFLASYLAIVVPIALLAAKASSRKRAVAALLAGAIVTALVVLPYTRPYFASRDAVGERQIEEITRYSATWSNYLATPPANTWYGGITGNLGTSERRLFPGIAVLLAGLFALWPPVSWLRVGYGAGLLFAIEAARGYRGWLYPWLHDHVLPYQGLRVPARFGIVILLSLGVLGGCGLARLLARVRRSAWRRVVGVVAVALLLMEYRTDPLNLMPLPASPPNVYAWLQRQPPAVVLELPVSTPDRLDFIHDAWYMYFSTYHWQRIVNGYSGFYPPSFRYLLELLRSFPDDRSLTELGKRRVTYIVLHAGYYLTRERFAEDSAKLLARHDVRAVGHFPGPGGGDSVFELVPER